MSPTGPRQEARPGLAEDYSSLPESLPRASTIFVKAREAHKLIRAPPWALGTGQAEAPS